MYFGVVSVVCAVSRNPAPLCSSLLLPPLSAPPPGSNGDSLSLLLLSPHTVYVALPSHPASVTHSLSLTCLSFMSYIRIHLIFFKAEINTMALFISNEETCQPLDFYCPLKDNLDISHRELNIRYIKHNTISKICYIKLT